MANNQSRQSVGPGQQFPAPCRSPDHEGERKTIHFPDVIRHQRHLLRAVSGVTGMRVEDVVITFAAFHKIAFIVAGSYHPTLYQIDDREQDNRAVGGECRMVST